VAASRSPARTCEDWLPPPRRYAIVFAFPPCTHFAVSGARWFQEKGMNGLTEALEVVEACRSICEWSEAPWMFENPVSTLSSYWRRPGFSLTHATTVGGSPLLATTTPRKPAYGRARLPPPGKAPR
jgi:hypothetical protein